jgi:glycosyltransferase involved in cell wall biosynthesis
MNEKNEPVVSVLMPVYNAALFLQDAIESILKQSVGNLEFLIIDDGSTDNSSGILSFYTQSDSRIQLITRENKGISYTRNQLVELAKGKYIAWMDADDISLPDRLELMLNWLERNSDYVAVGCKAVFMDSEGVDICNWKTPLDHKDIDACHITGNGGAIVFPSSVMLKKAVINVGGFVEELTGAEDLDLFLKLAEIGKIANIDNSLYKYRLHLKSISHTQSDKIKQDNYSVIKHACSRRGLEMPKVSAFNSEILSQPTATHIKWAWWALGDGHVQAARKHAFLGLRLSPTCIDAWKVFVCSIRGF